MKRIIIIMLTATFVTLVIPLFAYFKVGKYVKPAPEAAETVSVYIASEDRVEEMNKSQYLKETVAAEMPASFEEEALKAQAVAARSYLEARKKAYQKSGAPDVHKGADICTDFNHCKAWISEEKRRESWGNEGNENWEKISKAVEETAGEVMTYDGEVISAVFHSTSSGKTENSKDVWGGDKPYLVSVDSPGDLESPKFKSEKEISVEEFKKTAMENIKGVNFKKELIGDIARSEAGGIISISIGGVKTKGTVFRKIYDLRSSNAEITEEDGKIKFTVKGYGHGVGMSQYGANYLAKQGQSYQDILKTYYKGVKIEKRT